MKQKHNKIFRILLLLLLAGLTAVYITTAPTQAAPPISEAQAIAIATGQEVGENDFRISAMGGDKTYDAEDTAVAYNTQDNEYLVVWAGDDNFTQPDALDLADDEKEIYGQRVDAATGLEIGPNDFRISDMGPDRDANYDANRPSVAYDATRNQYLVVWDGDDDTGLLADGELEIFGQLLAADGLEIGVNDFRISDAGIQDGNTSFPATAPVAAYNPTAQEYLVVWEAKELLSTRVGSPPEFEIFGQRINAITGEEVGINDFRISEMGPEDITIYRANDPAVTYNRTNNQYLVVWEGDDEAGPLVLDEFEIYGQLLQANGSEIGGDFRISDMGPDGNPAFKAIDPSVAYNSTDNQYLVVWEGDDNTGVLSDNQFNVFGQLLEADGTEIGGDLLLSNTDPNPNLDFFATDPTVAYNPTANQYLVVWHRPEPQSDDNFEIFGQQIMPDGSVPGVDDFRISDIGTDGDAVTNAITAAVACQTSTTRCLVVWEGDDNTLPLVNDEFEIFGQIIETDGTETGPNDFRISDMGGVPDSEFDAEHPAVAYNTQDNEYLVVWHGDDNESNLVDGEQEIFGQRIDATTGQLLRQKFRISDMGPDGDTSYAAQNPAVAYNPNLNQYLVVWSGD
ncbi:MAG: hypothetical protein KC419_19750, partial [Anaerolineales bacterium]|nr:hypothetical protein [Anaerolineales bacterium]